MPDEPLLRWPEAILAYLEFAGAFLAAGALGFRYFVIQRAAPLAAPGNATVYADAGQRAAISAWWAPCSV